MREADLEQLYSRLEKPLYNVAYRWVWKPDEAQEIVQEAFVRLWRMRARVQLDTVEPLIYRIVLNLASSRRRSKRLWRWVSLEALRAAAAPAPAADELMARDERLARLRAAVEALPDELRSVIMLCEYSEMSYAQIATTLSIPQGTVGSRRNRALRVLREQLQTEPACREPEANETV